MFGTPFSKQVVVRSILTFKLSVFKYFTLCSKSIKDCCRYNAHINTPNAVNLIHIYELIYVLNCEEIEHKNLFYIGCNILKCDRNFFSLFNI
jgi:hypothetical protein